MIQPRLPVPATRTYNSGYCNAGRLLLLMLLLTLPVRISAQALPISIDGEFDDWDGASVLYDYEQVRGELPDDKLSVKQIHAANDEDFLFLRIKFDRETQLQENNAIALYLDTDFDTSTGYQSDSLGAELKWEFGERSGQFYTDNSSHFIRFSDLGLRSAPTVSSDEFEFAIARDAMPDGSNSLFQSQRLRLYVTPDEEAEAMAARVYEFDNTDVPAPDPIPLERMDETDLRITGFNAWDDKLFDHQLSEQYERIFSTLQPDIIAFQEIWDHNADQTVQRMEQLLPGDESFDWHGVKLDNGNVTVSRFPILDSWQVLSNRRLTAALIDAQNEYGTEILLINVHFRCCSRGENNRWDEINALSDFIQDAMQEGGRLHLEEDSPIIVAGDFNLVGSRDQLDAIRAGITEWDDSYIKPVMPRQTEKRMNYTWRNDRSTFMPGKLDYIFYTGSMLTLKNHYTLQVESMSQEQRDKYDLQFGDTRDASDHLPLTADFELQHATSSSMQEVPEQAALSQNYPNPFNPVTVINYKIPDNHTEVSLDAYTVEGRHIATLVDEPQSAGRHHIEFDATNLPSGIYIYRLTAGNVSESKMMTLIK